MNNPSNPNPTWNQWHEGQMVYDCKTYRKIPVFYGYVIAFTARSEQGLQDCDVQYNNNLCTDGANFIRGNNDKIVNIYRNIGSQVSSILGRDATAVFLIEPDFWQYYGDSRQKNGGISGSEMRNLYDRIVNAVKENLPKALFSWDIR